MTVVDLKSLTLNLAVMACSGKSAVYTAEEIIEIAKAFEKYITEGAKVNGKTA
jgi:hypothetical protein